MAMTQEEAEALVARRNAQCVDEDFMQDPAYLPPGSAERETANADLRAQILAAFDVTEEQLESLDPDHTYAAAKAAMEADREAMIVYIERTRAELERTLSAQFEADRNEALITTAHLVGCPECLLACPLDEDDPEKVCHCGFNWGHGDGAGA